ncbi:hypothetical protein [Piscibacillus salipiscarius]|uniref:Uncharacterized protein n=1 Tax=Piscibacillus salipiscarius TaxID=299480 RepID=A0ABW5QEC1_9BACI|nr:hypothetical protein [Piscibacillus salipiscarius]
MFNNLEIMKQFGEGSTLETIKSGNIATTNYICLEISKSKITNRNVKQHLKAFSEIEKHQTKFKNKVVLMFQGYDYDSREIYEIREIRRWVRKLVEQKPHIFYYLSVEFETMAIILPCIFEYEVMSKGPLGILTKLKPNEKKLKEICDAVYEHAIQNGETHESAQRMIHRIQFSVGFGI